MKLHISHSTRYSYSAPLAYAIQLLRLSPRPEPTQRALNWQIEAEGNLTQAMDAFGNLTHTLVMAQPHQSLTVKVHGVVDVDALPDGQLGIENVGALPILSYCVATPRTLASPALIELAHSSQLHQLSTPHDALSLASLITNQVTYVTGVTAVTATADEALRLKQGVCQDHAHLFLAIARILNVPVRYVSGYVHPGETAHAASHAWVDVWFNNLGWVSVDVTNNQFANTQHCRLAVGRDYDSACPIRGARSGGGAERLNVEVSVQ